ncbi:hypothetical protein ACHAWF_010389 [Thalassiosira exigua]
MAARHALPPPPRPRPSRLRHDVFQVVVGNNHADALALDATADRQWPSSFLYGATRSPRYGYGEAAECLSHLFVSAPWYAVPIALSVIFKRRSAKPGGTIHRCNQRRANELRSDRRRRLRDMLSDPVLVRDLEGRYGDLTSLRESVRQWEGDGFALQKKEEEDFVKVGGDAVVPWIRIANVWLSLALSVTLYCAYNPLTTMILLASAVHIVDNMLIRRDALARGRRREAKSEMRGLVADVGVPIPEAEVGVPVDRTEQA